MPIFISFFRLLRYNAISNRWPLTLNLVSANWRRHNEVSLRGLKLAIGRARIRPSIHWSARNLMENIIELIRWLYSPAGLTTIIQTVGLIGITGIVFAETGLLIGFFMPGDSLLVTAGILACPESVGGGIFDPIVLIVCLIAAAIIGDQVNYGLGRRAGEAVFSRPDGRLIKRKHFDEAHAFYKAHGGSAILLARFVPFLRTFVPFIAGVARMPYRRFVAFNVVGGASWVASMVLLGYFLGSTPLAKNLHGVIIVVVAISLIPLVVGALKQLWSMRAASRRKPVAPADLETRHSAEGPLQRNSTTGGSHRTSRNHPHRSGRSRGPNQKDPGQDERYLTGRPQEALPRK